MVDRLGAERGFWHRYCTPNRRDATCADLLDLECHGRRLEVVSPSTVVASGTKCGSGILLHLCCHMVCLGSPCVVRSFVQSLVDPYACRGLILHDSLESCMGMERLITHLYIIVCVACSDLVSGSGVGSKTRLRPDGSYRITGSPHPTCKNPLRRLSAVIAGDRRRKVNDTTPPSTHVRIVVC